MPALIRGRYNSLRRLVLITVICVFGIAACTRDSLDIELETAAFGVLSTDGVDEEGNPRLLEQTQQIPMREGTSFGFQFRAKGKIPKDSRAKLRFIWHFPPPGLPDPSRSKPLQKHEQVWQVQLDQKITAAYLFEQPWELLPGKWRVEIWQGRRKLTEQSFDVVEP